MAELHQLLKVLTLADQELEKAVLNLRGAQSALQALQEHLKQLQNYRWDYVKQAQDSAGKAQQATHYQQYHHMIGRLDGAVTQHMAKQRQAQAVVEQRQTQWQQAHQRQQAITLLIEQKRAQALALEGKREQKALDEFAMQALRRRQSS